MYIRLIRWITSFFNFKNTCSRNYLSLVLKSWSPSKGGWVHHLNIMMAPRVESMNGLKLEIFSKCQRKARVIRCGLKWNAGEAMACWGTVVCEEALCSASLVGLCWDQLTYFEWINLNQVSSSSSEFQIFDFSIVSNSFLLPNLLIYNFLHNLSDLKFVTHFQHTGVVQPSSTHAIGL